MLIRPAGTQDLAAIAAIYNHAVLHTTAIWNDRTVDLANRAAWMEERQAKGYPVLVSVDAQGTVTGYAAYGDWRAFDGFRHTVEHSVYVHPDHQRGGIGRALLTALVGEAKRRGKHVMVAAIEAGNQPSIALHRSLGFVQTGLMPEVGTKFGRWLDLVFLQLNLDETAATPAAAAADGTAG
ncbi:GNAT family N-acetyltransferase [Azospirillum thermophilum]|uniref:GNAT family N-acetyltransferase n=1 Tax=Azospirillum thermophilum TaxID=2202148 RepID=A0A2S2CSM4_9PROT|nr:GNAT family N-acetyltransferase [Azospirillum thermophilum]AWK87469.1 GNAT family N-acetyltransferase [Azospirillum thermophilum]